MKFFIQFILIALFTFVAQYFFPWWAVFIVAAFVGVIITNTGWQAFLAGFLGIGLLWFIQVSLIDATNQGLLSRQISELFQLPSSLTLRLITALIGGLCGGFGALTGKLLTDLFKKERRRSSVYW